MFGLFAVTRVQSEGEDEELEGWGGGVLLGAAVMIYGGVIHNRCHRLCVFFCQATDGRGEKTKKGEGGAATVEEL